MIEDKWINFVLLNGWRIKAEVDEATGDMTIIVSNEKGNLYGSDSQSEQEEYKEVYKLVKHEE
jgi:prophage maintenance system killer protein